VTVTPGLPPRPHHERFAHDRPVGEGYQHYHHVGHQCPPEAEAKDLRPTEVAAPTDMAMGMVMARKPVMVGTNNRTGAAVRSNMAAMSRGCWAAAGVVCTSRSASQAAAPPLARACASDSEEARTKRFATSQRAPQTSPMSAAAVMGVMPPLRAPSTPADYRVQGQHNRFGKRRSARHVA
jgi:hypothetical protein